MAAQFVSAARDLRSVPAGDLHERFVGWLDLPTPARDSRGDASRVAHAIAAWGDLMGRPPDLARRRRS